MLAISLLNYAQFNGVDTQYQPALKAVAEASYKQTRMEYYVNEIDKRYTPDFIKKYTGYYFTVDGIRRSIETNTYYYSYTWELK